MRNKYTYIVDFISCIVMIIYSGTVLFLNTNAGKSISFLQVGIVLAILIALTIFAGFADGRIGKVRDDSTGEDRKSKQISNASWIAALVFVCIASLLKMRWELGFFIAVLIIGVPNILLLVRRGIPNMVQFLKQRRNGN